MNNQLEDHSYRFASTFSDIDFQRIVRETAEGTAFILVESRTRLGNSPLAWALLAHQNVLVKASSIDSLHGKYCSIINGKDITPYKAVSGAGKVPGSVRKAMETTKRIMNPRNVITTVSQFGTVKVM